jgi:adenosylcobinamide kinase/adenosylcobinamide-phosphate guanylyltransferase
MHGKRPASAEWCPGSRATPLSERIPGGFTVGRLTLVTGGAASGKSRYAVRLASSWGERILFVATCVPSDDEMLAKVARHRAERPVQWTTVETSGSMAAVFQPGFDGAIVDCLTLFIAQLLVRDAAESDILAEMEVLCRAAAKADYPTVLVTNEVGDGIVPENPLGRRFREIAGRCNQLAASLADEVEILICGISLRIKHAG